jgi:hypothetical protein
MEQYYHRQVKMPKVGQAVELVNRKKQVQKIGIVIGFYPRQRIAKIKILNLDEKGNPQ